jgi:hypothetical protein
VSEYPAGYCLSGVFFHVSQKVQKSILLSGGLLAAFLIISCPQMGYAFTPVTWVAGDGNSVAYNSVLGIYTVTYTLTMGSDVFGNTAPDGKPQGDLIFHSASAAQNELLDYYGLNLSAGESLDLTQVSISLAGTIDGELKNRSAKDQNVEYQKTASLAIDGLAGTIQLKSEDAITVRAWAGVAADEFPSDITPADPLVPAHRVENVQMAGNNELEYTSASDLEKFLAGDTITMYGDFQGTKITIDAEGDGVYSQSVRSTGTLTLTYQFGSVPEPGALSLLWLGCAALALRRPRVRECETPA